MRKTKAQVFFILTITLFLIVISVGVIFGAILAQELITQRAKIDEAKVNMLLTSGLHEALRIIQYNPEAEVSGSLNLRQGRVSYSIDNISATTSQVLVGATIGRITKNLGVQIGFNITAKTIESIRPNY